MGFSLLTNQREARFYGISRKIKGGEPKKTQEIGAFSTCRVKKPEKPGFSSHTKENPAAWISPRGPIYKDFTRLTRLPGPYCHCCCRCARCCAPTFRHVRAGN